MNNQPNIKPTPKRNGCILPIVILLIIVVLIIFVPVITKNIQANNEIKELQNSVIEVCQTNGLENVEIVSTSKVDENIQSFVISTSTDLSKYSYTELINMDKNISDGIIGGIIQIYKSNGDNYAIFSYTGSIYKNGNEVYSNYYGSESHNDSQNNNSAQSDNSSSDNDNNNYSTDNITENEKGFAWAVAEEEVKNNLKSPSSAKFPTYSHATISKSGNDYKVVGYCDAENSFGATLKTRFTVEFTKTGEDSYILKNVFIYD